MGGGWGAPTAGSQGFCLEPRCLVKTGPGASGPLWLTQTQPGPGAAGPGCFSLAAAVSPPACRLPGGGVLRLGVGSGGAGGWWRRGAALGRAPPSTVPSQARGRGPALPEAWAFPARHRGRVGETLPTLRQGGQTPGRLRAEEAANRLRTPGPCCEAPAHPGKHPGRLMPQVGGCPGDRGHTG